LPRASAAWALVVAQLVSFNASISESTISCSLVESTVFASSIQAFHCKSGSFRLIPLIVIVIHLNETFLVCYYVDNLLMNSQSTYTKLNPTLMLFKMIYVTKRLLSNDVLSTTGFRHQLRNTL
jgi:hypothetical protein